MRRYNATLEEIDVMDGLDFERYVARLLEKQGFKRVALTERYDMGVDIVAERDGERWGVQVKRYNGLVKAAAIRQVVTALNIYGCQRAMVVTNSTYSNVADRLATSNGCVLIDRNELIRWMR
jgi:restriction system protein